MMTWADLKKIWEQHTIMVFFLGYVLAGCALSLSCLILGRIQDRVRERKLDKEPCHHGVAGGKTRLRCELCKLEDDERQRKLERERRRAEIAKNIAAEANQFRREELARLATLRTHELDFLLTLTPEDFEGIVAKMYRQMGFSVQQTPMSNDFGRDLILQRTGKTTFVECKRYAKDKPIGRPALQKFYAAIMTLKADSGIVVTTSRFTATAIEFARENHIQLIDGQQLASLMARAFPSGPDANQYRVMCRECRDIVTFDLRGSGQESRCRNLAGPVGAGQWVILRGSGQESRCRNGHLVKKDI